MDKKSKNPLNIEKKTTVKFVSKSEQKNVDNSETGPDSEIGPDSEMLTSNTREPVDMSFNRLSFIQNLEAEDPVSGVGT